MTFTSLGARAREHPLVWEALRWALPAIAFGAVLRALLLYYMPYAYWGADSKSYYSFAHMLLSDGYVSLDEKRRFLYPILMLPVSLLPGAPLKWVAWLQHGFGLLSLVPLAYVVRRAFVHWRWWIVPVTVAYTGLPVPLWYEHELLGEAFFFTALLFAFAGWIAWTAQCDAARHRAMFWWFFVPLALFVLTKPSGRFIWPGVIVAIIAVGAWRQFDWRRWLAMGLLLAATPFVGSRKQGAWLLYTASFPLTQLESPLHAEYKAEIRDFVEPLRRELDLYYLNDTKPFEFLRNPREFDGRPLWQALARDEKQKAKVYADLALEGIKAEPLTFLYLGLQRAAASANLSMFDLSRFDSARLRERTEHHYADALKRENSPVRRAFGLPRRGALPPWEEFANRLDPAQRSAPARALQGWVAMAKESLDFIRYQREPRSARSLANARPTLQGWLLAAGMLLAFLPRYRRSLGVWTLIALSYTAGVFIVSEVSPRYFAPIWPMLLVLLALPGEALVRSIFAIQSRAPVRDPQR